MSAGHDTARRTAGERSRATSVVSAVLLVVLLATTGWPEQSQRLRDEHQVACCEERRAGFTRRADEPDARAPSTVATVAVATPWMPPRTRRVDSWGLPPPRAPTN